MIVEFPICSLAKQEPFCERERQMLLLVGARARWNQNHSHQQKSNREIAKNPTATTMSRAPIVLSPAKNPRKEPTNIQSPSTPEIAARKNIVVSTKTARITRSIVSIRHAQAAMAQVDESRLKHTSEQSDRECTANYHDRKRPLSLCSDPGG